MRHRARHPQARSFIGGLHTIVNVFITAGTVSLEPTLPGDTAKDVGGTANWPLLAGTAGIGYALLSSSPPMDAYNRITGQVSKPVAVSMGLDTGVDVGLGSSTAPGFRKSPLDRRISGEGAAALVDDDGTGGSNHGSSSSGNGNIGNGNQGSSSRRGQDSTNSNSGPAPGNGGSGSNGNGPPPAGGRGGGGGGDGGGPRRSPRLAALPRMDYCETQRRGRGGPPPPPPPNPSGAPAFEIDNGDGHIPIKATDPPSKLLHAALVLLGLILLWALPKWATLRSLVKPSRNTPRTKAEGKKITAHICPNVIPFPDALARPYTQAVLRALDAEPAAPVLEAVVALGCTGAQCSGEIESKTESFVRASTEEAIDSLVAAGLVLRAEERKISALEKGKQYLVHLVVGIVGYLLAWFVHLDRAGGRRGGDRDADQASEPVVETEEHQGNGPPEVIEEQALEATDVILEEAQIDDSDASMAEVERLLLCDISQEPEEPVEHLAVPIEMAKVYSAFNISILAADSSSSVVGQAKDDGAQAIDLSSLLELADEVLALSSQLAVEVSEACMLLSPSKLDDARVPVEHVQEADQMAEAMVHHSISIASLVSVGNFLELVSVASTTSIYALAKDDDAQVPIEHVQEAEMAETVVYQSTSVTSIVSVANFLELVSAASTTSICSLGKDDDAQELVEHTEQASEMVENQYSVDMPPSSGIFELAEDDAAQPNETIVKLPGASTVVLPSSTLNTAGELIKHDKEAVEAVEVYSSLNVTSAPTVSNLFELATDVEEAQSGPVIVKLPYMRVVAPSTESNKPTSLTIDAAEDLVFRFREITREIQFRNPGQDKLPKLPPAARALQRAKEAMVQFRLSKRVKPVHPVTQKAFSVYDPKEDITPTVKLPTRRLATCTDTFVGPVSIDEDQLEPSAYTTAASDSDSENSWREPQPGLGA